MRPLYIALSILSAALFLAGIHPLNLYFLSFFFLAPLFIIFLDKKCRLGWLIFYVALTGLIIFSFLFYWILFYNIKIYFLVILAVTPTLLLYFLLLRLITFHIRNTSLIILTTMFLWIFIQGLYQSTPLGTIPTEIPFYSLLPLHQIGSILPYYALSSLIIGLNISLITAVSRRGLQGLMWTIFISYLLASVFIWGKNQINIQDSKTAENEQEKVKIAVIQHNLPISGRWRLENLDVVMETYKRLGLEAAKQSPDLIVYPLYSLPGDYLRNPDFFINLAEKTKSHILLGTYIPKVPGKSILKTGFHDTAILYSGEKVEGVYQATQPPPFRELNEFTAENYKLIDTPFGKIGVLLCYEDAHPKLAKEAALKGAEFLVALSNPGHFSSTHMPYYHLIQDRLRAIESGRAVVRASSNGYSAFVDKAGRFSEKSDLNEEKILFAEVERNRALTSYDKNLNLLFPVSGLFLICLFFRNFIKKKPVKQKLPDRSV